MDKIEQKEIARSLVKNKDYMSLIKLIMLKEEEDIDIEQLKTISNEQLGEIVRANKVAEHKIIKRLEKLQMLGNESTGKGGKTVPS